MGRRLTALLAVLVMLLLAACQGKPLPGGMEETALLDAGQEALLLLAGGDYGGVYGLLREDVAEAVAAHNASPITKAAGCASFVKIVIKASDIPFSPL